MRPAAFLLRAAVVLLLLAAGQPAKADTRSEILQAYRGFAEAQNARDLRRIGTFFTDGPDLLWVSDGQSFWGREAILQRMSAFQKAPVWHVVPDIAKARVVVLADDIAMLHMPLVLEIGQTDAPDQLPFLVSILFRHQKVGWRITALLTTGEKAASR